MDDTYYEVVWIDKDGEHGIDGFWVYGWAQECADDYKSTHPDVTVRVVSYNYAGYVYEGQVLKPAAR